MPARNFTGFRGCSSRPPCCSANADWAEICSRVWRIKLLSATAKNLVDEATVKGESLICIVTQNSASNQCDFHTFAQKNQNLLYAILGKPFLLTIVCSLFQRLMYSVIESSPPGTSTHIRESRRWILRYSCFSPAKNHGAYTGQVSWIQPLHWRVSNHK